MRFVHSCPKRGLKMIVWLWQQNFRILKEGTGGGWGSRTHILSGHMCSAAVVLLFFGHRFPSVTLEIESSLCVSSLNPCRRKNTVFVLLLLRQLYFGNRFMGIPTLPLDSNIRHRQLPYKTSLSWVSPTSSGAEQHRQLVSFKVSSFKKHFQVIIFIFACNHRQSK